jgi:hypothetical protein
MGLRIGNTIRKKVWIGLHPSIVAASSISRGMLFMNPLTEGLEEARLSETNKIVLQPHKGLCIGEGKRRIRNEEPALEGIHQDKKEGNQVQDSQNKENPKR